MHDKPVIGLAGGIGSGKSAVAKALAELGCVVSDSDQAARDALNVPAIRQRIINAFGEDILHKPGQSDGRREPPERRSSEPQQPDQPIDRSALAHIIFSDPAKRRLLESITHPWIEQRRLEQFANAPTDAPACVIDAPLLFEAGLDATCDAVIFVDTPRELRLERVRRNRGWDEAELNRREATQLPLDEKRRRADHVISNEGSLEELAERTRRILARITHAHSSG